MAYVTMRTASTARDAELGHCPQLVAYRHGGGRPLYAACSRKSVDGVWCKQHAAKICYDYLAAYGRNLKGESGTDDLSLITRAESAGITLPAYVAPKGWD